MKTFQILDKDDNVIPMSTLNKEAAEFWKVELLAKDQFVGPIGNTNIPLINWFHTIGSAIVYCPNYTVKWRSVAAMVYSRMAGEDILSNGYNKGKVEEFDIIDKEEFKKTVMYTYAYAKPYIQLILHWKSKGYKPKQVGT
jgi:hypothetical protein